ncbi:phage major capsid protein [Lactiplantibacillus plantarum]|uniref:phage major capsid protein n=1 Tax=Lactiplantibacillus plantarum TaxID=1590 RepID=UPI000826FD66|nr:phage major capsid protein [Lactiplantibacillus plantarum]MZU59150.1 phage major capsid protein [Lactiplantibacillus plantarum]MZU75902.1 phage major capsid protein [Lactiplantibacillus plantarum]MZV43080.1 phage major capsid protein [Lactiplantibacillus plantarum]PCE77664.1 phage major capsid protein [Lactiplantibacillus plantarum]
MIKDLRLVQNAELRAQQPQGDTPEDADDQTQPDDQQQPDKQQDKQPKTIEGYALLFNSPSKDLGGFTEVIDPKALDNVDLSNVIMLDQHDYSKPLASVKAGTLKLDTDEKGLHFTATLDDSVSYANDAYQNVKSGNVDSMSFRFDVDDGGDEFTQDEQGKITRTIKQVKDLFEVSTVTIPAYDDSNVQVDKRSYEEFLNNQKGEKQDMTKQTIINPAEQGEARSFDNYIRSQGETRDGLTTDGNGVLIPSEVVTPIFQSKKGTNRLSDYATVKQVSVGQGSYPIAGNDPSKVLATKAENAAIGDVDPEVTGVEFKTQTRAGKVYLSQELVDDNAINFSQEIQAQMAKLVDNTDNAQIVAKLKTLTPVVVKDVDGIKQAKNTKLDPSLQPVVVVNQSAFNWLDTQKDSEGRYLMSEDIQSATGRSLFGLPVVELSDAVLPNAGDGQFSMFIGDLAETICVFRRNQVSTKWQQFDSYSQGLAIMLRNDYEFIDKTATVALTIDTTKA